MSKKIIAAMQHVKDKIPEARSIGWLGEWAKAKIEVSVDVPFEERHDKEKFGEAAAKKLGEGFQLTFVSNGIREDVSPPRIIHQLSAVFLVTKNFN